MRFTRQLHLYLGTFFAPSIIFFAISGGMMALELHEGATAKKWISELSEVHRHQRFPGPWTPPASAQPANASVSPAPTQTAQPAPAAQAAATPAAQPPRPPRKPRSKSFKVFSSVMAAGLILSSIVGIVMAFQLQRSRAMTTGLLAAGTLVPIVLLYIR
jgi:hypothetical protein